MIKTKSPPPIVSRLLKPLKLIEEMPIFSKTPSIKKPVLPIDFNLDSPLKFRDIFCWTIGATKLFAKAAPPIYSKLTKCDKSHKTGSSIFWSLGYLTGNFIPLKAPPPILTNVFGKITPSIPVWPLNALFAMCLMTTPSYFSLISSCPKWFK
ncbi:MAG: hypothetical protein KFW07_02710, partial [Mycoplasmataceae bacterium]|nr:hypothetical protein [Mycoplasmataceae bacterium]